LATTSDANAQQPGKRIAFVVGDAAYQAAALATPANDAGLVAQTLQASGFEVVGARDLDQAALVNAWNDFLAKLQAAGADTVAFVYLAGYGMQLDGENYFASVDAQIAHSGDIATQALRLSDLAGSLASVPLKVRIVVLDAARATPFALDDPSIAGGLALVDPDDGSLIAFNAAPGTIAPESQGAYGAYAQALAEMIGQGGLPLDEVFTRTRMRVAETTNGAFMPWNASKISAPFLFREGTPDAANSQARAVLSKPVAELGAQEAFVVAEHRDTVDGYQSFLAAYPDDPLAPRVRATLAVRREAIVWRRTYLADTQNAYWSYLARYPQGPHAGDTRRRLTFLAAALEPPPTFAALAYDLPPPPPDEMVYIERPVMLFAEPAFAFAPPPPLPFYFVPPVDPLFVVLPPPVPPLGAYFLPVPVVVPVIVNRQVFRPTQPIAVPVMVPSKLGIEQARFSPLVNPALRPDSLKQTRPLAAPGPRPLVNPAIQQGSLAPQGPATNKLTPQQQLHLNQPPAANAAVPAEKLRPSNQGRLSTTRQPLQAKRQPVGSTAIQATKPNPVTGGAGNAHVNLNAAKPLRATPPPNTRVSPPPNTRVSPPPNVSRQQIVNRQPPGAPRPAVAPKPAPGAARAPSGAKPAAAAACGRPGQPPCRH
jgi:uncharacterized caspase-like protein